MADQVTSVSKKRFVNQAGSVSSTEMGGIARSMAVQLDL